MVARTLQGTLKYPQTSRMALWKINELLREFPETNVIEVNEIYSVPLKLPPSTQCTILINLPPLAGPNSPPILFCEPSIPKHPMIEKDGLVKLAEGMGADGDLVSILRKIIQLNPKSEINPPSYNNNNIQSQKNYQKHLQRNYKFDLSLIDSLSEEQVNNLLADDVKFRKFLSNFKNMQEDQTKLIEDLRMTAREKAEKNIILKKEIDALAAKLDETHEKYTEASQSYQNMLVLNSSALAALNPDNVLTEIQVNLMELNDSSNNSIKEALKCSETDNLDLVLKECVKLRKEYHSKTILLQKLQE